MHKSGIKTSAMIAPILPGAEKLINLLVNTVDNIIVDRMNYNNANFIYKKYGFEEYLSDEYFLLIGQQIKSDCSKLGIDCDIVF